MFNNQQIVHFIDNLLQKTNNQIGSILTYFIENDLKQKKRKLNLFDKIFNIFS